MKGHSFNKAMQQVEQQTGQVRAPARAADDDEGPWYEGYKLIEQERQAERAGRRGDAPALLTAAGIRFESKNLGAHLVIKALGHTIDFWPGTTLWMVRGSNKKHRGVEHLIARCTIAGDTA